MYREDLPELTPDIAKVVAVALKNYDHLIRDRGFADVNLHWESGSLVYGEGGCLIDELCRPGFTQAT